MPDEPKIATPVSRAAPEELRPPMDGAFPIPAPSIDPVEVALLYTEEPEKFNALMKSLGQDYTMNEFRELKVRWDLEPATVNRRQQFIAWLSRLLRA